MKRFIFLFWLVLLGAPAFPGKAVDVLEGATVKGGKLFTVRGEQLEAVTENLNYPADIEVNTNGYFQVAGGAKRQIQEGQILLKDGWLLSPGGSIEPVLDHAAMKEGKVYLVRDGQAQAISEPMSFPNRLEVNPDGMCVYPSGSRTRLMDGQLFRLDGTSIPGKDTVTLKNGSVVVQKEGSLLSLPPTRSLDMNDGSRVNGDGSIQQRDGRMTKLRDGQTILVEGAIVNR